MLVENYYLTTPGWVRPGQGIFGIPTIFPRMERFVVFSFIAVGPWWTGVKKETGFGGRSDVGLRRGSTRCFRCGGAMSDGRCDQTRKKTRCYDAWDLMASCCRDGFVAGMLLVLAVDLG